MKQRLKLLIFFLFLILVGCSIGYMPTEVLDSSPPTVILSSTLLPTMTPVSTTTITPHIALPPLTPLPTLSREQTFSHLFMSENACDVPCWWGIIPGVSTWRETEQYIEQFSDLSFGVYKVGVQKHLTSASLSETYVWYVGNPVPNTDSSTTIYLEVKNNIVTALEIGPELVWNFFPIYKLLETYGQPDEVFLGVNEFDIIPPTYYARIYLFYEDKHLLTSYGFSGLGPINPQKICLYEYGEGYLFLWSDDAALDFDFSKLKPLGNFSGLSPEIFYESFKDDGNKCIEITEDAWK